MVRRAAVVAAGFLAAAALAACAPTNDMQQLQSNEFALRGMVANDRQQIDALQERVAHLSDRLSELEHNGGAGPNSGLATLNKRVSKLEAEVGAAQTPSAPSVQSSPSSGAPPVASIPSGPEGAPPTAPANTAPPAAAATTPSWRSSLDQELATSQDDKGARLYRAGLEAMRDGNYSQALTKFQDLQHRYPKSSLSEPAEYFSANALFEMGKYDQSILQFNDLTLRFPKGKYSSSALLREAQAFMQINDRIDARLTLQKLLNDHPDSPEAASAKSMMQTLAS